jgi:hypothetical protein
MSCPLSHVLTPLTHSLTIGPCIYVRNNIACWYAFLIRLLVMLTPLYSCHWVINSSALVRSPVKIRGVFPTNLSFHPPGIVADDSSLRQAKDVELKRNVKRARQDKDLA